MAEVLIDFDIELKGPDNRMYGAQACGRERDDGMWEAWLEFDPVGGGEAVRSGRETTQPNRKDLMYWATGLTASYLDGALLRTLRESPALRPRENPRARPHYEGPAESPHDGSEHAAGRAAHAPTAVLDPFRVYAAGPNVLRGQLNALSRDQLGNIVKSYGLAVESSARIDGMSREQLVALIMKAVETR